MIDNIEGGLNRMQAGMAAGNGNATQVVGVANIITKLCKRLVELRIS